MNFLKSKKLIALLMLIFLSFSGISHAKNEGKVFVITLGTCNTGQLSLVNVFVKKGFAPDKRTQPSDGYEYKIVSQKGKVLYSYKFIMPSELTLYCSTCGSATQLETKASEAASLENIDTSVTLIAPYFEDAKAINIYDNAGKLQLEIDVSNTVPKPIKSNIPIYVLSIFLIAVAIAGGLFIYLKFYKKPKAA